MNTDTIPTPLLTDGYKLSHRVLYPEGTTRVYSNFTARKSRVEGQDHVVVFGIQYFCLEYLIRHFHESFFLVNEDLAVERYARRVKNYLGAKQPDEHLRELHRLGYLPLRVKALPEGTLCPMRVPFMTIDSTDERFFWLTNYVETLLSTTVWGPVTSATTASRFRRILNEFADRTVGNRDFVPFQAHDFSMRGTFGLEAAIISGMAHLTSFVGTDTLPAIDGLEQYYEADSDTELVGVSIPASEHAVTSAGGDVNEEATIHRWLTEVYPDGPISVVADTWDYWHLVTVILPSLKDVILARRPNANGIPGKLVIRPDSGDGVEVVCGKAVPINLRGGEGWSKELLWLTAEKLRKNRHLGPHDCSFHVFARNVYYRVYAFKPEDVSWFEEEPTPELKGTITLLWELFGGTETAQGYKLLNEHIGCILGEGVTTENLREILQRLQDKGFASTNMVFGVGSYGYQHVTRDTYGLAMKATYCEVNGEARAIFKNPKTDVGTLKKSARGLIQVHMEDGKIVMHDEATPDEEDTGLLEIVFENGRMVKIHKLSDIRDRLSAQLDAPPAADLSQVSTVPSQPTT